MNKYRGIADVFKFAFVQLVKSKAFIISQLILCAVALLAFPVVTLISGDDSEELSEPLATEYIGTIYIEDCFFNGALGDAIAQELKNSEEYGAKEIEITTLADHEQVFEQVTESEDGDVLIHLEYVEDMTDVNYGFMYYVYYGEKSDKVSEGASELAVYVDDIHEKSLAKVLAGSDELAAYMSQEFSYEVSVIGADDEIMEASGMLDMGEYWVTYAFLMIVIFSVSIVGGRVAEQLVTEKSNKVIEYIMTSVKPMALITGKVMASVATVVLFMGSIVVCLLLSAVLNGVLFPNPDGSFAMPEVLITFFDSNVMAGATPVNIIISILVFLLGVTFYAFIGGIAGATVSKVEEMAEGMKLFTFATIIGAYVPMFLMIMSQSGNGDWGVITNIIYIFPLTSIYILPAYILLGKVTTTIGLISLAVMVVGVLLMMSIVSRIFEYLIYYNGSPLKLKDLIGIYKDKRRAK